MKIAFTGSHSTGKTTMLASLKVHYSTLNLGYVTEVARGIIKKGYPLNMDANVDSYIHYINDQLIAETAMANSDIFISDRTILDPLAYAQVNRDLPRPFIPEYFIDMMKNVWLLEKERYNLYVHFKVEFPMHSDEVRPEDEEYRERIDSQILCLLEEFKIPYITISGSHEERVSHLVNIIDEFISKNVLSPEATAARV